MSRDARQAMDVYSNEPDYTSLDPGIRQVVRWLRAAGFNTHDSGDGVTKADWIAKGTAMEVPHVFVRTTPGTMVSDASDLLRLVRAAGIAVQSAFAADRLSDDIAIIDALFCPVTNSASLCLFGVSDDALP